MLEWISTIQHLVELELIENLEQLRYLENGKNIKMVITDFGAIGIDTMEDLN